MFSLLNGFAATLGLWKTLEIVHIKCIYFKPVEIKALHFGDWVQSISENMLQININKWKQGNLTYAQSISPRIPFTELLYASENECAFLPPLIRGCLRAIAKMCCKLECFESVSLWLRWIILFYWCFLFASLTRCLHDSNKRTIDIFFCRLGIYIRYMLYICTFAVKLTKTDEK